MQPGANNISRRSKPRTLRQQKKPSIGGAPCAFTSMFYANPVADLRFLHGIGVGRHHLDWHVPRLAGIRTIPV